MQVSELLNRITKAKRSQIRLRDYLSQVEPVLGAQVEWCGSWLHFREWLQSGDTKLLNANFCKRHMLCQACAVRRAGRMNESYLPKVESVCEDHPKLIPAMVTLTVKNGADLEERVKHLKGAWSRMLAARRKAKGNHRHSDVEWCKVLGSLRAMEVTKAKNGEWHPHFHVFVLLTDYIDQRQLSAEWLRYTGDSKIVGVTKCKGGIRSGLVEVLKYSCKFSSMGPEDVYHVFRTLKGSRLVDPQGVLRGVKEPDIDSDDISGMEGPYRDFIASWIAGQQRYHLQERKTGPLQYLSHPHKQKDPKFYEH